MVKKAAATTNVEDEEDEAATITEIAFTVQKAVTFWRGEDNTPYVRFGRETWPVESLQFDAYVRDSYLRLAHGLPSRQSFEIIMDYLRSRAASAPVLRASTRVVRQGGSVYFNLCDPEWRCVRVTADGWDIMPIPDGVPFIRSDRAASYPTPEKGGHIDILKRYLNYGDENNWRLLVGFILAAMRDEREYPILVMSGTQGSAKTTVSNILLSIIDPAFDSAGSLPEKEEDIAVTARIRHVLAYDNVSKITAKMSDSLCKLATGLTINKRRLYTDHGVNSYTVYRPVVLNGIPDIVDYDDMGRRMLSVFLEPPTTRIPMGRLLKEFETDKPLIFGAIMDSVSCALKNEGRLPSKPVLGLVSVAEWVEAASPALGWEFGEFTDVYNLNREATSNSILDGDDFARFLVDFIENRQDKYFSGTYDQFVAAARAFRPGFDKEKYWPHDAKRLIDRFRRIAPAMAPLGVNFYGLTASNGKVWRSGDSRRLRMFEIRKELNEYQSDVDPGVRLEADVG